MKFLTHIDLSKNQLQNAVVHPLGTAPSGGVEGQIYYNSTVGDKKLYIYNGSTWTPVGDITSVVSTTPQLAVTSGTSGDVSLALNIAPSISNGGAGLVTSDLVYDYIDGLNLVNSLIAGNGITVSSATGNVTVSHAGTSSVSNLIGSGRTYVTGLTFDAFGHVTGVSTGTETVVDTNTTYDLSVVGQLSGALLSLVGNDSTTDSIFFGGIPNEIAISASGATVSIGLPDDVTITNNLVVGGNLTVSGTVTTVNTETILLADNIITINSNATGIPTENGGIEIERGSSANVSVIWNEATDRWQFTNDGITYYNIPVGPDATQDSYTTTLTATSGAQTVTHNLGSRNVIVQLYDTVTYETLYADIVRTSSNDITVTFVSTPPNAVIAMVQLID
jgi:hypothetical protein